METSHKKTIISLVFLVVIVVVAILILSGASLKPENAGTTVGTLPVTTTANTKVLTPDQVSQRKAEILKLVSGSRALTEVEKTSVLNSISGEKALQYNFTEKERDLIVKALNRPSEK